MANTFVFSPRTPQELSNAPTAPAVFVAPAPRVRLPLAASITGLTVKAMQRKIADGKWLEGREYHRDPDGCIWIDMKGVMQWVAPVRG